MEILPYRSILDRHLQRQISPLFDDLCLWCHQKNNIEIHDNVNSPFLLRLSIPILEFFCGNTKIFLNYEMTLLFYSAPSILQYE